MTTEPESTEEFDLNDPYVQSELRVILKALVRLLEHSKCKAKRSRAFQEGLAVYQKKASVRRSRTH